MTKLQEFVSLLSGKFDNAAQHAELTEAGQADFPFAEHRNTPCNDKIRGLPADFDGVFLVEESYYTVAGRTHASPHLFLFTQEGDNIRLTSYDTPEGYDKNSFTAAQLKDVEYASLRPSQKFTPALYTCKDGVWEGGSVSMFTPVLKFTLFERFSPDCLEVTEQMEMNGKRTFGYDVPILYKRK